MSLVSAAIVFRAACELRLCQLLWLQSTWQLRWNKYIITYKTTYKTYKTNLFKDTRLLINEFCHIILYYWTDPPIPDWIGRTDLSCEIIYVYKTKLSLKYFFLSYQIDIFKSFFIFFSCNYIDDDVTVKKLCGLYTWEESKFMVEMCF